VFHQEGQQRQVTKGMTIQGRLTLESILGQLTKGFPNVIIRQGHQRPADIAHGRDVKLLPQPAGTPTAIHSGDYRRKVNGVVPQSAEDGRAAGSTADNYHLGERLGHKTPLD
jgi:hypothetical protein